MRTPSNAAALLSTCLLVAPLGAQLLDQRPDAGAHDAPMRLIVTLDPTGHGSFEVAPGPEGLEAAGAWLNERLGPGYTWLQTWRVLELLADPAFRRELAAAGDARGGVSHREWKRLVYPEASDVVTDRYGVQSTVPTILTSVFRISINPTDSVDLIYPHELLKVPARGGVGFHYYRVEPGDTVGGIAHENGTTIEAIVELNKQRFRAVHPHRSAIFQEVPRAEGGGRNVGSWLPIIRVGEHKLEGWSDARIREVLLHEIGHVADIQERCEGSVHPYGPDQHHMAWMTPDGAFLHELITPNAALKEGWGNYRALVRGEDTPMSRMVATFARGLPTMRVEWEEGEYETIPRREMSLNDLLSSEWVVGRILARVHAEGGLGGYALTWAMGDTLDLDCRTLAEVLGAYVRRAPGTRDTVRKILVAELHGLADEAQVDDLLDGIFPTVGGKVILPDEIWRYAGGQRPTFASGGGASHAGELEVLGQDEHDH